MSFTVGINMKMWNIISLLVVLVGILVRVVLYEMRCFTNAKNILPCRIRHLLNISYCPPNASFPDIWQDDDVFECCEDMLISSLLFCFMIAAFFQTRVYRRYGVKVPSKTIPKSNLYRIQLILHGVFPLLDFTQSYRQKDIYGHTVR